MSEITKFGGNGYTCDSCGKWFGTAQKLFIHHERKHEVKQ